jgi:hypothetical protein
LKEGMKEIKSKKEKFWNSNLQAATRYKSKPAAAECNYLKPS